jgi:hypothetical protein
MTISHSTMNYRKVMTKLKENNITFVIQTISSMNYFDSNRKYNNAKLSFGEVIGTVKSFGIHNCIGQGRIDLQNYCKMPY